MVRAAALALTFVTGFSGLAYEVAWQRYHGVPFRRDALVGLCERCRDPRGGGECAEGLAHARAFAETGRLPDAWEALVPRTVGGAG